MKKYLVFSLLVALSASVLVNAQNANPASDFVYDINSDVAGVVITAYEDKAKDVIVPVAIEDFPVVGCNLGDMFEKDNRIVSVVLPNSCTEFYFEGCNSLEKMILPKELKTISWNCVKGCKALKAITLPDGLEKIDIYAFQESVLESIVIPTSVKSIGRMAFYYYSSLKTVNIRAEHVNYGDATFSDCSSLSLKEQAKMRKTGYTDEF